VTEALAQLRQLVAGGAQARVRAEDPGPRLQGFVHLSPQRSDPLLARPLVQEVAGNPLSLFGNLLLERRQI